MAALSVTLNGETLACVSTDGFDVMRVGVSGDLLGPQHATLRVSGGSYPQGHESQYLVWEDERTLVPGDKVSVAFLEIGSTSRPGKTIEELYPDEKPTPNEPFAPVEKVVEELKQRPKTFDSLAFEFIGPDGVCVQGRTSPEEHGFAFTVLWNSNRPEKAGASAHTYSLESLITRGNGKYHGEARLTYGQSVTFTVLAPNSTVEVLNKPPFRVSTFS